MNAAKCLVLLALIGTAGACVGREIFHIGGCMERLGSPYKQQECVACVQRPFPHEYLPDQPDGARCARR